TVHAPSPPVRAAAPGWGERLGRLALGGLAAGGWAAAGIAAFNLGYDQGAGEMLGLAITGAFADPFADPLDLAIDGMGLL
ncbi:MAG: hypothetical protein AAF677_11620, partial [Pseudomonadota bacterium]